MQQVRLDEQAGIHFPSSNVELNSASAISRGRKFSVDFKYLFLEQILQFRTSWPYTLAMTVIFPLLILFGFGRIGGVTNQPQKLVYIIAGSVVYAMVLEGCFVIAQHLNMLKREGRLLYYASLP